MEINNMIHFTVFLRDCRSSEVRIFSLDYLRLCAMNA